MIYKKLGKLIGGANSKDWDTKHSVYSPIKKKGKLYQQRKGIKLVKNIYSVARKMTEGKYVISIC